MLRRPRAALMCHIFPGLSYNCERSHDVKPLLCDDDRSSEAVIQAKGDGSWHQAASEACAKKGEDQELKAEFNFSFFGAPVCGRHRNKTVFLQGNALSTQSVRTV